MINYKAWEVLELPITHILRNNYYKHTNRHLNSTLPKIKEALSILLRIEDTQLHCVNNYFAKFEIKGMETVFT